MIIQNKKSKRPNAYNIPPYYGGEVAQETIDELLRAYKDNDLIVRNVEKRIFHTEIYSLPEEQSAKVMENHYVIAEDMRLGTIYAIETELLCKE